MTMLYTYSKGKVSITMRWQGFTIQTKKHPTAADAAYELWERGVE